MPDACPGSARYIVPFPVIEGWLDTKYREAADHYDLPFDALIDLIRRLLQAVPFDADWYLADNPGLSAAITNGKFASVWQHFLIHGYFEGRTPFAPHHTGWRQPMPFSQIRSRLHVRPSGGVLRARLSRDAMRDLLSALVAAVPVDDIWYRDRYPGVAAAIEAGEFASATTHFAQYGFFETRWPFAMTVDEGWYRSRYHDVPIHIANGTVQSGQQHFEQVGYREGRVPFRYLGEPPATGANQR